ncbi:MAG: AAA family ATPase [Actinobacteria bacterium]|nr:AAA family ATPase [Actinomycetota bacterium]
MLTDLKVSNLGVIEELELSLGPGLTVLTGETGAGKTFLVGALILALGGKADASNVRAGSDEAAVEARFVDDEDAEFVVRRLIPGQGRSRAYLNGNLASASELEALGARVMEIHGQHQQLKLVMPAVVRSLIDEFGQIDLTALQQARFGLAALHEEGEAGVEQLSAQELELLRFQVDEINAAGISALDEDLQLRSDEEILGSVEELHRALDLVAGLLDVEDGVQGQVGEAMGALKDLAAAKEVSELLTSGQATLAEAALLASKIRERIEFDPGRLAEIQQRRRLFSELRRKYGADLAQVQQFALTAAVRLERAAAAEQWRQTWDMRLNESQALLAEVEAQVRAQRTEAGAKFSQAVSKRIRKLAIGSGQVAVDLGSDPAGDHPRLLYSSSPELDLKDLASVASGGELSRILLAIAITVGTQAETVIFDEIDAGVGGQAALAIAQALKDLSKERQVIVVTHLAQVAAAASQHVVLARSDGGSTKVHLVRGTERVEEVARMLSGFPDSSTARAHAEELIDSESW